MKKLYLGKEYVGYIGEKTGVNSQLDEELCVGDIVLHEYNNDYNKKICINVICENARLGDYVVMGLFSTKLSSEKINIIKMIVSHEDVTDNILNTVNDSSLFKIVEVAKVPMTLSEIEEKLGYEVELVEM